MYKVIQKKMNVFLSGSGYNFFAIIIKKELESFNATNDSQTFKGNHRGTLLMACRPKFQNIVLNILIIFLGVEV